MKSIIDYTNKLKSFFAEKQALSNEVVTRSKLGAHNLLLLSLDEIKANNSGTWVGNVYTSASGLEYTVNVDSQGYVTSIKLNGTAGASTEYLILTKTADFGDNISMNSYDLQNVNGYIMTDGNHTTFAYLFYNAAKWTGIRVNGGASFTNHIIYPMVRLETDTNETFETAVMTNKELTEKVVVKKGTITGTNITEKALDIKQFGNVVTVNGYLRFTVQNSDGSTANILGTITGVDLPPALAIIRTIVGLASNPWEKPAESGILVLTQTGDLTVKTTLTGNKSVYMSFSYIVG